MTLEELALARADVDRAAHHRVDEAWLDQRWADARSRVLVVSDGTALVSPDAARPRLLLLSPSQAPPGQRYFLGLDSNDIAHFAVASAEPLHQETGGVRVGGLRELGASLTAADVGLLVHAVSLDNWHRTHPRCPRCGTPTEVRDGCHIRRCPADGSDHYPRTDPAVIMSVVRGERILLGRHPSWPPHRFSTLAGFVEPGESLEQAVRREVHEEVGVRIGEVSYLGSQPWPFPSSLMLGFVAHAQTEDIQADGTEISEARWFGRAELSAAVRAGTVVPPSRVSIARRLIEHWYGGTLGDGPQRW